MDVRSPEWRRLILEEEIPRLIAKGYPGVLLDTLDTAEHLESLDPKRYAGSLKAMEELVREMRETFPQLLIVANNGLPLIARWGELIDGVMAEDVYTHYDFSRKAYGLAPEAHSRDAETSLMRFREASGRPVFLILYADDALRPAARRVSERALRNGFWPYITDLSLKRPGIVAPGGKP